MKIISKHLLVSILLSMSTFMGYASGNVRFHSEGTDTIHINEILIDAKSRNFNSPSERTGYIARKFLGKPYVESTLEHTPELVTVNIDEFDCSTFFETVLALSYTVGEGRTSWRDFVYNLERLRYRGGELDGYPSRLHYICDWIVDNTYRGNVQDATRLFPRVNYVTRTIDYMSENRDKYPALADSANFSRLKDTEIGYRSHRFPYIKTIDVARKETKAELKDGDAVALVTSLKNLDVTHMGFVVINNGEPYLLHASSKGGQVEISSQPLSNYLKRDRNLIGIRVIRLNE